jgi:hypothetical protein
MDLFQADAGATRARSFRLYSWRNKYWGQDYLPDMREYIVQGHAWKLESWRRGRDFPSGGIKDSKPSHN